MQQNQPGRPRVHSEPRATATFYIPVSVHEALREESRRSGVTMSRIVEDLIRKELRLPRQ